MSLSCDRRFVVPLVLIFGLGLTGCRKAQQTFSVTVTPTAPQAVGQNPVPPANTKVNILARLPAAQRMVSAAELKQLGLFYQTAALNGQPPRNLEELDIKATAPKLYQAIADKDIIVYWKTNPNHEPAGASNTVLAYDVNVLTKKSAVLMADGTVTTMEPDEFNKAPKGGS